MVLEASPTESIVADVGPHDGASRRPMLGPAHRDYGQSPAESAAPQVTLPALPEIRRWVERTQQERAALQARADRLREQFEPLRKQLAGIERSIKVLDHFLGQIAVAGVDGDVAPAHLTQGRRGGMLLDGRWSRKYVACRACGTTNKKHKAQGYCFGCYDAAMRAARPPTLSEATP